MLPPCRMGTGAQHSTQWEAALTAQGAAGSPHTWAAGWPLPELLGQAEMKGQQGQPLRVGAATGHVLTGPPSCHLRWPEIWGQAPEPPPNDHSASQRPLGLDLAQVHRAGLWESQAVQGRRGGPECCIHGSEGPRMGPSLSQGPPPASPAPCCPSTIQVGPETSSQGHPPVLAL